MAAAGDGYDPHLERKVEKPTTNAETLVHMLKGAFGTGILAMPEAIKNSGLLIGAIFTLIIGFLCTYGLHMLVRTQYILCKRMKVPLLTYPESMKAALLAGPKPFHCFANCSVYLVDIFIVVYQLGICCCYVIFVAANLKKLMDPMFSDPPALIIYTLFLLIPFTLMLSVPDLKWLAPFSLLSNFLTIICFGMLLKYLFEDLPDITDRPMHGTLFAFPLFFGTVLFALEAVGVIISLENNMATPKSFGCVLNTAMLITTLCYLGIGFLGFWRYGDDTQPSVTLNIPEDDLLSKLIQGLYSFAILISYGLQGFPPISIMWTTYLEPHFVDNPRECCYNYLLRFITVLVTFILALTVPYLGLFISLFGSFCLSALGVAFPAIMEICVLWPDELGRCKWILLRDLFLILIGIIGLVAGSYSAISEIVSKVQGG